MLAKADMPIEAAERLFAPFALAPAYLAPTETALNKSIMDATEGIRALLQTTGLHNFDLQQQGPDHKAQIAVVLFHARGRANCVASLYRPQTKKGDPRIWISDLKKFMTAGNLIALLPDGNQLIALVVSSPNVQRSLVDQNSEIYRQLKAISPITDIRRISEEVIGDLRRVAAAGWIPAFRKGPTAVGMTLERALGITPNPDQAPDYKGFELKAKVLKDGLSEPEEAQTRQTLFAKVPNWKISPMSSSRTILAHCGYPDTTGTARRRLYCEISSLRPNSQGLQFKVDHAAGHLVEVQKAQSSEIEIARWRRQDLEAKLNDKHSQTAWLYARERTSGKGREFRYFQATLTMAPRANAFLNLLESGVVSMDHLIKEGLNGRVCEKGPLFKIYTRDLPLLFPYRNSALLL